MQADIFDGSAIEAALRNSGAETVIDQLTSLPADPANYAEYFPGDRRLRLEGGGTLHRAARRGSIRRYIQQSSGFFLKPQLGVLATEEDSLAVDASPGIAASAQMYAVIERRLEDIDGNFEVRMPRNLIRHGLKAIDRVPLMLFVTNSPFRDFNPLKVLLKDISPNEFTPLSIYWSLSPVLNRDVGRSCASTSDASASHQSGPRAKP